jgi:hypothetical protein
VLFFYSQKCWPFFGGGFLLKMLALCCGEEILKLKDFCQKCFGGDCGDKDKSCCL